MKMRSSLLWLTVLPFLCLLTGCACPRGKVKVNSADASPPEVFWEVTQEGTGTRTLTDANAHITLPAHANASVIFKGRDSQSGIKTVKMKGGFGFTCKKNDVDASFAGHGIVPERVENLAPDAKSCVPIEFAFAPIDAVPQCREPGLTPLENNYYFQGEAVNQAGVKQEAVLTLSFEL